MSSIVYTLTPKPYSLAIPTPATGSIASKTYTTMGFNSEYTLTYNIAGNGLLEGFIDLS
jgi:hypothetical protein